MFLGSIAGLVAFGVGYHVGVTLTAADPEPGFPGVILGPDGPEQPETTHVAPVYVDVYPTLEAAGVAGIQHAYDFSNSWEYGGVILLTHDGKFLISVPNTDWSGDSVRINDEKDAFPGLKIVGDYHTHPCLPFTHYPEYFSPPDVQSDFYSFRVGIMGDFCTGNVHEFTPGVDPPGDHPVKHGKVTTGRVVGKITLTKLPIILEADPGTGEAE